MMYRQKKGHAWKVRVSDDSGKSAVLTTGAHDADAAEAIEAMLARFDRQGAEAYDVRRLLVAKRVSLPTVFYHYSHGTLNALLREIASPDLAPLVSEWKRTANAKYAKQVARFIGDLSGVNHTVIHFSRGNVSRFLAGLPVSGSTKVRYRAALMVFGAWLVERGVLDFNPVQSVRAARNNPSRELYHERPDAIGLVKSIPAPFNAIEALMANGLERQVIERLSRKDVDLDRLTINAHGSKTPYRNRVVRITEAWTVPIIEAHLKALLPNAPVLTVKLDRVLDTHKRACKALQIPVTTLHDWRHTYAVNSLRDGMKPTTVARQLGHRDASLVHKVYGRFIVDERDYITKGAAK